MIVDFGTAGLRSAENELAATTLLAGSFHLHGARTADGPLFTG